MGKSDVLKERLGEIFVTHLSEYFKSFGDGERTYLTEKAVRIREECLAVETAATPEEVEKHKALLEALVLAVETETIERGLAIAKKNRALLVSILKIIVEVLIATQKQEK